MQQAIIWANVDPVLWQCMGPVYFVLYCLEQEKAQEPASSRGQEKSPEQGPSTEPESEVLYKLYQYTLWNIIHSAILGQH